VTDPEINLGGTVEDLGTEIHESLPIAARQEETRARLATVFAMIFAATIFGTLLAAATGNYTTAMGELLDLILPAEMAILGTAVGFYFGTQATESQGGRTGR
jgi:hypothetical protein